MTELESRTVCTTWDQSLCVPDADSANPESVSAEQKAWIRCETPDRLSTYSEAFHSLANHNFRGLRRTNLSPVSLFGENLPPATA